MKRPSENGEGLSRRNWGWLVVIPILVLIVLFLFRNSPPGNRTVEEKRTPIVTVVDYMPTPRPTPRLATPAPTTPPPDEKVVAAPSSEDDKKPEPPAPKPAEDLLGTGIKGNDSASSLASGGNGIGNGTFGGLGEKGSFTELERYGRKVQDALKDTLQKNPSTKNARFESVLIKVFPDPEGTITEVKIINPGKADSGLLEVIKKALLGTKVSPPPHDFRARNYEFIRVNLSAPLHGGN